MFQCLININTYYNIENEMNQIIFRRLFPFIFFFFFLFPLAPVYGEEAAVRKDTSKAPEKKIAQLEKEIQDLQDGMALLMENLGTCVEENEELSTQIEDLMGRSDLGNYGEKRNAIRKLKAILKTDADLSFLLKIGEDDLKKLVKILEKFREDSEKRVIQ